MAERPGPLVTPNDGYPWEACAHPDDRIEWRRDDAGFRWVGICRRCGIGRAMHYGDEPIVRTDEQLARGDCPSIPAVDRFVAATTAGGLHYQPWISRELVDLDG